MSNNLTLLTADDSFTSREHAGETLRLADHCRFIKYKVGFHRLDQFTIPARLLPPGESGTGGDYHGKANVFVVLGWGETAHAAWKMAGGQG